MYVEFLKVILTNLIPLRPIFFYLSSIDCVFRELKNKNASIINFSYLNINWIRNKFENLREIIDGNVGVLCVAKTKIDSSFPTGQFSLAGYHSPYRSGVSNRRFGLLVHVNASISARQVKYGIKYKNIQFLLRII